MPSISPSTRGVITARASTSTRAEPTPMRIPILKLRITACSSRESGHGAAGVPALFIVWISGERGETEGREAPRGDRYAGFMRAPGGRGGVRTRGGRFRARRGWGRGASGGLVEVPGRPVA